MTAAFADFYDAELARHQRHFGAAAGVGTRDRVLDVGCGAGLTTREAARAAPHGEALGVDVSVPMLEVARQRCADEALRNARFELADAQTHPFPAAHFDVCISRFGVMFFADPGAAFANIARSLRAGGRLAWMVWQDQHRNEWSVAIRRALGLQAAAPGALAAFSLGDRAAVAQRLSTAGFDSIGFAEVREPVFYGPDADAAFEAVAGFAFVQEALADSNPRRSECSQGLREVLQAHSTAEGVLFDSRAWIVTARRADG